jgi:hypothetical protein
MRLRKRDFREAGLPMAMGCGAPRSRVRNRERNIDDGASANSNQYTCLAEAVLSPGLSHLAEH